MKWSIHEQEAAARVKYSESYDDQLVSMLQIDGRTSFSALARELAIPRSVVANRVSTLMQAGALHLVAAVHPRVLGLNALAHISIRLNGPSRNVVDTLIALDAAAFVSLTTGSYGVVAELRYPTMDEMYRSIDNIKGLPEVSDVSVMIYHNVLRSFFLGKEPEYADLDLDEIDLKLIGELQIDGRLSFGELGTRIGLSVSAARSRVLRLLDTHVLQIGAIRGRGQAAKGSTMGFGITTSGSAPHVIEAINNISGVEFIARCFGNYDLVVTYAAADLYTATSAIDEIRGLRQVTTVSSWAHLRIVKEHYNMSLDRLPTRYAKPHRGASHP